MKVQSRTDKEILDLVRSVDAELNSEFNNQKRGFLMEFRKVLEKHNDQFLGGLIDTMRVKANLRDEVNDVFDKWLGLAFKQIMIALDKRAWTPIVPEVKIKPLQTQEKLNKGKSIAQVSNRVSSTDQRREMTNMQIEKQEEPDQVAPKLSQYTIEIIDSRKTEVLNLYEKMKGYLEAMKPKVNGPILLVKTQHSEEWLKQRRTRLTASSLSNYYLQHTFEPPEIMRGMIYSYFNPAEYDYDQDPGTRYGHDNESIARNKYVEVTGNQVDETGFWIRGDYPWIGGSPDGIVKDKSTGEVGLLEIKCPYSARGRTIEDFTKKMNSYMGINNGKHALDHRHRIYIQLQVCMFVLDAEWCDFVVWTDVDIHIERIKRNEDMISRILDRMTEFYVRFILPSLSCGSHKLEEPIYYFLTQDAYTSDYKSLVTK